MRRCPVVIAPVILLALLALACPSSTDLDKMAKASNELAHDLVIANNVVAEFYKAGKIPLAAKDKIADKLGLLGSKGQAFNNILIDLDKKYPQGTIPPQDLQFLKQNLNELRRLYTEVFADLLPFGADHAVKDLDADLVTIERVAKEVKP